MSQLKAVYINWSQGDLPAEMEEWVTGELARIGVAFSRKRSVTKEELAANAGDAEFVVFSGHDHILTRANVPALAACKAVVVMGSGTESIDVPALTERGIILANTPNGVTEAVSDHGVALILGIMRHVAWQDRLVKSGVWDRMATPAARVTRGAKLGMIGLGLIGQALVRKLSGLEMTIQVYDPYVSGDTLSRLGVQRAELNTMLAWADIVSIQCPLTPQTRNLIGEEQLRLMQPHALLVNLARGAIVEEPALVRALTEKWIAGAALDVLVKEPPDRDNPLFSLPNVIITPHMANYSVLFPSELWRYIMESIAAIVAGKRPLSVLNPEVNPSWLAQQAGPLRGTAEARHKEE